MVKIPIGNGSKNTAQNEHIFDAVVGLAVVLGETPLMICGDLQHEPRRQSRHLDFALSQGWFTVLGQTHKPAGAAQPCTPLSKGTQKRAWNEALHAAVGDFEVVQPNLVPKHKGLKITLAFGHLRTEGVDDETTHDSECGRPATPGTHLSEKMETGEPRTNRPSWWQGTAGHSGRLHQTRLEKLLSR